jgi:hypothetical protein
MLKKSSPFIDDQTMSNIFVKTETFDQQNIDFRTNYDSMNFENRKIKTELEDVDEYSEERAKKKRCKKCKKCLKRRLKKQRKKEKRKMRKFLGSTHHEKCQKNSFQNSNPNWELFNKDLTEKQYFFR